MMASTPAPIRRGFVEIAEGQVHYRTAGWDRPGVPLMMLHPSPGSARMLEPLMGVFGQERRVIATDTLGNGDSSSPADEARPSPISPMRIYVPLARWGSSASTCMAATPAPTSPARSPLPIPAGYGG
jgi:pimeloyl-ACP methyl ester carboxylesterase